MKKLIGGTLSYITDDGEPIRLHQGDVVKDGDLPDAVFEQFGKKFVDLTDEEIKAVEAAEPKVTGTALPDDFPARAELISVGIDTLEKVITKKNVLPRTRGIGKVNAELILKALETINAQSQ